jgi:hypothetical protein
MAREKFAESQGIQEELAGRTEKPARTRPI